MESIKKIIIKEDFLVFKEKITIEFCKGINVFIGGNGTGKTTLIKTLFWWAAPWGTDNGHNAEIERYFGVSLKEMKNHVSTLPHIEPILEGGKAVFIPVTEMLSHSKGFLALNNERLLPFDYTEVEIIAKAELPETRKITSNAALVLDKIKNIIGGEVVYEDNSFFTIKGNNKIPFSLEASGFRKFGLLWKLLRNGLLESGSILFWDEPENSLNPELIPVLVDILLELSKNGVQIFLATHDYNLARYFDIRKNKDIPVLFHNLSKKESEQIVCESSPKYLKLSDNLFEKASADLFEAVVSDTMGEKTDE